MFGWMVQGIFDNESYSNALCASRTFGPKGEITDEFGKYVLATGEGIILLLYFRKWRCYIVQLACCC